MQEVSRVTKFFTQCEKRKAVQAVIYKCPVGKQPVYNCDENGKAYDEVQCRSDVCLACLLKHCEAKLDLFVYLSPSISSCVNTQAHIHWL